MLGFHGTAIYSFLKPYFGYSIGKKYHIEAVAISGK